MSGFITREVDYAIRIVAYLAGKNEKVKIDELCKKLFLKRPFVIKIVHKLSKCNIIKTATGKNGGILLHDDAKELSIFDICQCLGLNTTINICTEKPEHCELNPICNITSFFSALEKNLIEKLKKAKIKHFIFNDEDLNNVRG